MSDRLPLLSEDVEALARKWTDASASARRLHIHFPADCLAEAAEFVRGLAAREAAAAKDAGERAWDEGAEAGFDSHAPDDLPDVQARNPYRAARIAREVTTRNEGDKHDHE